MKPCGNRGADDLQDPFASLDPRMRVGDLIGEPLTIHRLATGSELRDRVEYLVSRQGLEPEALSRYPHEPSGGHRQRIVIARALSPRPMPLPWRFEPT
jgi:peptide/nickel transport system ATP-binding protein